MRRPNQESAGSVAPVESKPSSENAAAVERGVDVSDTLGLEAQRLVELVQRFQLDEANSAPPRNADSRLAALPR